MGAFGMEFDVIAYNLGYGKKQRPERFSCCKCNLGCRVLTQFFILQLKTL